MDLLQPVVIDFGTGLIKSGIAGDEAPKLVFPSLLGAPKHPRVMAGAPDAALFHGQSALSHRGLLRLRRPLEHGVVTSWPDVEHLFHALYGDLHLDPRRHPVLLTECPLTPLPQRERLADLLFGTSGAPAAFFALPAVLALYASGALSGLVLDSGAGVTHAVPVAKGFALPHAVARVDVGGDDVDALLRRLLWRRGTRLATSAEAQVAREVKERVARVALRGAAEVASSIPTAGGGEKVQYRLPDGQVIEVGEERWRAPEMLFAPEVGGVEGMGAAECVHAAIMKSDMDLRKELWGNVVLAGGSTLFAGYGERLLQELQALAPRDVKLRIAAPPERVYSAWIGGSILAALSTFRRMWVSAKEFEEEGYSIVHRKTFN